MEESLFLNRCPGLRKIGVLKIRPSVDVDEASPICVGMECLDRRLFDPARCYAPLAAAGVKHARCQTGWARTETVRGRYDFGWLDDIVDALLVRGIKPWFNVSYGNPLYMPDANNPMAVGYVPLYYGDEVVDAWLAHAKELARHFAGRVTHFEIWNEPEGAGFWHPVKPDPVAYAQLIRITAAAIRCEIPDAKIGACSDTVFRPGYMKPLFETGIADTMDFYAIHAYRLVPELGYDAEIRALRRLIATCGGAHLEIWQGEAGYAARYPDGHWMGARVLESEANQAKWALRRYFTDVHLGLRMSSFFQAADMVGGPYATGQKGRPPIGYYGLIGGADYIPRPALSAVANLSALLDGRTRPCESSSRIDFFTPHPKRQPGSRLPDVSARLLGFTRGEWPFIAYYVPEDVQEAFPGYDGVKLWYWNDDFVRQIENPVLADPFTGSVWTVSDWKIEACETTFRSLPATDYPLVITDRAALDVCL